MSTDVPVLPLIESDELQAIRGSIREIADRFGPHYMRECYERDEPPNAMWEALSEGGFVGINVPEEWDGGGLGMLGLITVAEELAANGSTLLLLVVSSAINGSILAKHGTTEQKETWLRGVATGTKRLAFAITEPDAGTNSHNLRTTIKPNGNGKYVINGQKTFISGVEQSDAILVVTRAVLDDGNLGLPSLALVDVDAPGLKRDKIPMPYLGPDHQWTLFLDDVEVDEDRLIGGFNGGLGPIFDGLNPERIIGAALAIGGGRLALEKASAYARERTVWKTPIGAHQGIAHPLAKAKINLDLAWLMTQKAAVLNDAGAKAGEASNMAKYAAAEAAIEAVERAIQTHGGNGITLEYGLSDLWWGVRLTRTAPVSAEMILNFVAEHSLGLPKSY